MRQAASVTRTLTYPRRGLHGEVVHLIGLQIMSGELKPGDPLPPRTSSSPTSRSAAPCCARRCACSRRRDSWRRGPRPGRVFGLAPNGTSSIPTSSAGVPRRRTTAGCTRRRPKCGSRSSRSPRAWRRRGRPRTRPPGSSRHTPRWRRGRRSGGIPRCRPSLPRSDPRRVPQRAARSPRCRPSRGAPHDLRAHDDAAALTPEGAPPAQGDHRQHRGGGRGRCGGSGADAHRRHRGGHPPYRPPGRGRARSAAPRARTSETCRYGDVEPSGCGIDDRARRDRVPRNPSQWYGRAATSQIERELRCLRGVHVPDDPRDSRSGSRPLIGSSATPTRRGFSAAESSDVTIVSPAW